MEIVRSGFTFKHWAYGMSVFTVMTKNKDIMRWSMKVPCL